MMQIKTFFHRATGTLTHLLICNTTQRCAIIDPCYDFDIFSGKLSTEFSSSILKYIKEKELSCEWILETHAHADHITSAQWFKQQLNCKVAIGKGITKVQEHFKRIFNLARDFPTDGSQFDQLLEDGDSLSVGDLTVNVVATPGHTDDSVSYWVKDAIFVGDTLFSPQRGTARCDFPGGSAEKLYQSIQKIYAANDSSWLYLCHDYPEQNQEPVVKVTLAEQKKTNCHITAETKLQDFVELRHKRDKTLSVPKLLYPSLQVNIAAGQLPSCENNNQRYLKIPLFIK
jgi:glyoxylase-like metal-dependent hydrolase (beta-lactamase superfamily II)